MGFFVEHFTEVVTGIISGLMVWLITYMIGKIKIENLKKRSATVKIFPPIKNKNVNEEFYDYYEKCIRNAESDIYMTGTGVPTSTPKHKEVFRSILKAMAYSMRDKKANIVRIQGIPDNEVGKKWIDEMKILKKEYPDSFKLYLVPLSEVKYIAQYFVIDPWVKSTVAEILFPEIREERNEIHAGTGIFIEGDIDLSKYLSLQISQMQHIFSNYEYKVGVLAN